jgi:peptidyl-prolyl cis-trans isomerase A (cyclophilin A)
MFLRLWLAALTAAAVSGCDVPVAKRDEPLAREPVTDFSAAPGYDPNWAAARSAGTQTGPSPNSPPASTRSPIIGDPLKGRWTLKQATATLPAGKGLVATIATSMGEISCDLWPDKAPDTVALVVGLANGQRPWRTKRGWLRRPAFDGSRFDRVNPGLAILLGRPTDVAAEGLGLSTPGESWPQMSLAQPGLLCLQAPRGPGASLTLVITDGPAKSLTAASDGGPGGPGLTVLGTCRPLELIHRIATAPATDGRPLEPATVKQLRVSRPVAGK